jgi:hypothetical protein
VHPRKRVARNANVEDDDDFLPTPQNLACDIMLWCRDCFHCSWWNRAALIAGGQGNVPVYELRWHCEQCGSGDVGWLIDRGPPDRYRRLH